ncbi:hypothetical protein HanXRQr2_Chr16g0723641 [Helianthus annuus]|uniref:Uncharacterized protein n=1 Tax=Helianthus annuus TaxID=4232 RepID=A0A9K3DNP0_HELAN|nr:hypothetical protein HanXRQr2_Chr16g0723641 [Helianthus annuus]KAJ0819261.1 hypothetical protein HanPSC8_Chr16g0694101 [Helianthus annuus]
MKIWWFYSDKIFPNYGPDEKFRCQIRQYSIPPKLDHGRPFPHLYQERTGVVTDVHMILVHYALLMLCTPCV